MADQFTEVPVKGKKTNNNAAAGGTNVGVLAAVANAAAQSWTEGNQVALSTDLSGSLRVIFAAVTQDINVKQINGNTVLAGNGVTGTGSQRVTVASDNTPFGVKIVDTGGTNQLAVNASGQITISNATFAATQSGTWTVVTNSDANIAPGTAPAKAQVVGLVYNTAAPTPTNGQTLAMQADSSGNLKINVTNATIAVTQSGSWTIAAGAALIGKVGIDQTTPGTTNAVSIAQIGANTVSAGTGASGTGVQRTVLTNDYLSTAQISKNTTINSATNPISVQLSDGAAALGTAANPLSVMTQETTGTLKDSGTLTSAALAAGGTANLDTVAITNAVTGKILEVTMSSSVRIKAEVQTITGAGPTVVSKRVFFVAENEAFYYKVSDIDSLTLAGNGTTSKFRIAVTNMDNLNAADVYGSVTWVEA